MQYQSTRDSRHTASAAQAILQGIAPDGGLYMLSDPGALSFPMAELVHMSAMEISERVLGLLLPGFTREELHAIVTAAYTHKFETEDLVPLVPVGDRYILELFRGPTSAFKDVALSVLPHLICAAKAKLGVKEDILILTGESQRMSSVEWIGEAIKLAAERFSTVGIEIYPANVADYKYLHECGADFVTVFQETYNPDKYETLHLMGHKRVWPYRFEAQERALMGGMRGVGFSALLGLDDFRKDALATALHVYYLQRKYPHAEMSLSCPRLRPIINNDKINPKDVHETQLCQILCAYRIFLPYAGITVSSREVARFRDHIIRFAATKISAGVSTGIGDHEEKYTGKENEAESGDEQFEIADNRSLQEIYDAIKDQGLQPVLNEYIYV